MDGPIDWWWKMNLLDVCVQAGFCQIRSHICIFTCKEINTFTQLCCHGDISNFKALKIGQNLHANMEGFRRGSHIAIIITTDSN